MSQELSYGDPCPKVQLVSGSGARIDLAEVATQQPLIVVFYHLAFTAG